MSKNISEKAIKSSLVDLWNSCKNSANWNPDYSSKPFWNALELLAQEPSLKDIYDFELISDLIIYRLNDETFKTKNKFTEEDANDLISTLKLDLSANLADHWIIVPINHSSLRKSFSFDSFHFLSGSRKSKIKKLAHISGVSINTMTSRALHTEKSSHPHFLQNHY